MRSPKWPNTIAPTGRAKNATAMLAYDDRSCIEGEAAGKNSGPNTSEAAVA